MPYSIHCIDGFHITLQSGALLNSIIPTLSVFAVSSLRLIPAANSISNGISQMRFGRFATQVLYNDTASLIEYIWIMIQIYNVMIENPLNHLNFGM